MFDYHVPDTPPTRSTQRQVLKVSELNRDVRLMLERGFPLVWVEGEISNLSRPSSGHLYFSLKDSQAQVRCAMFRNRNMHLGFSPENGQQVLIRAKVGLYEPRGDFQLIAEHMEEAGNGALRRAYEALKQRLEKEGLFAETHKQALPSLPKTIGVVTSPSGAAIRDILTVLRRRFPAIAVIIYPTAVQGQAAAAEIAQAIHTANQRAECDVLIVGRGGGSLEDLWAFNEEVVARAIHASSLPVVSAVGHEIDFTIADFVADRRAPTPSAAAEMLSPDGEAYQHHLQRLEARLYQAMQRELGLAQERLTALHRRLRHPGQRLQEIAQRLDEWQLRLVRAQQRSLQRRQEKLIHLEQRLQQRAPAEKLAHFGEQVVQLQQRMGRAMAQQHQGRQQALSELIRALDAISPLAVLARGYSITRRCEDATLIRQHDQLRVGDKVETQLHQGRIICEVEEVHD